MDVSSEELSRAVALLYDGESAPKLVAKGENLLARQIADIANQHEVPLYDDAGLVNLLMQLEIDDEIPEALYIAVAHILSFAWNLRGKSPLRSDDI